MSNAPRCALYLAAFAIACGVCWDFASDGATLASHLGRCGVLALAAIGMGVVLVRRVWQEDRVASTEAALCREASAQRWADRVLEDTDLLLARLNVTPAWRHADGASLVQPDTTSNRGDELAFSQQDRGGADARDTRAVRPEGTPKSPVARENCPIAARPGR